MPGLLAVVWWGCGGAPAPSGARVTPTSGEAGETDSPAWVISPAAELPPLPCDVRWAFPDADGDGYGAGPVVRTCAQEPGYAPRAGDCDDTRAEVYPGAPEIHGDGAVNDCDGAFLPARFTGDRSLADAPLTVRTFAPDRANFSAVAGVGDVDGDGLDDVLLGGSHHTVLADRGGAAYLLRGGRRGDLDIDDADGVVLGTATRDYAGWRVSAAGDVNGDGHMDVIVLAGSMDRGAWLVHGPWSGTISTENAAARLPPAMSNLYSYGVAPTHYADGVGDVDGDGFDDVVVSDISVGADAADGGVYLFRGPLEGDLTLDDAWASWLGDSSVTPGQENMALGRTVAGVQDVTGDGLPDLAMTVLNDAGGAPGGGGVYIVGEPTPGEHAYYEADARIVGNVDVAIAGQDVAGGRDVDGDGYGDVLLGGNTWHEDDWVRYPAQHDIAWLVLGPIAGERPLDGADLIVRAIDGYEAHDGAGVALPGDMDGDGFAEVAVGVPEAWNGGAIPGAIALFYGPVSGTVEWTEADALFWGAMDYSQPGLPGRIDAAGDTNGDGFADLVVAAGYPTSLTDTPEAFLLLGGDP